jgi:hypothetical protein
MAGRNLCIGLTFGLLAAGWASGVEPEFQIQIKDHRFVPAELHIPAGVKVRIVIDNLDETQDEFDSHSLNREKHIPPKSRVTLFIGPLDPGRYVYEGESSDMPGAAALGVIVAE